MILLSTALTITPQGPPPAIIIWVLELNFIIKNENKNMMKS